MTQKVICDGCGAQDHWSTGESAFLPDGGKLFVRIDKRQRRGLYTFDLCGGCLATIFDELPLLKANVEERMGC